MPPIPLRRKTLPFLLAAALATPWALSAEPRREARPSATATAPGPLSLLGHLWGALTSAWAKTGCRIDPDGRCAPDQASGLTAPADTGCHIDPNGCAGLQAATVDEGCRIDPDGRCLH